MRKWWKRLGFVAGCLAGLEAFHAPAAAQFPMGGHGPAGGPPGGMAPQGLYGQPPFGCDQGGPPSLPNDGSPNAFNDWEDPYCWRRPVFWFGAEGVYGLTRRAPLGIPLVSSSTAPDISTNVGAIGQSATVLPASLNSLDLRHPAGYCLTLGFSPTPEWIVPFEMKFLYLHDKFNAFAGLSDDTGNPLLARPINSTTPGQEGEKVYLSSFPNLATGSLSVDSSLLLWGLEMRGIVRTGLQWGDDGHGCAIDLPIGVRYLELHEAINVSGITTPLDPVFAAPFLGQPFGLGSQTIVTDVFKTTNTFVGADFGIRLESRVSNFSFTFEPRVSVGCTRQALVINGNSVLQQQGQADLVTPGGILAVGTNGGIYNDYRFTVLPEGTFHIGWDIFSWLRLQGGYNIVYWQNVVRPGDQLNRNIDVRQVPTDISFTPGADANSPFFPGFLDSNFLLQSVSIGAVISF